MSAEQLQYWANVCSVLTFLIACLGVFPYLWQLYGRRCKRIKLERYLQGEKKSGADKGQRSTIRIMRDIGLTEDEIVQASFNSNKIKRRVFEDKKSGLASDLLFEYLEQT